jgi:hypothetical protein
MGIIHQGNLAIYKDARGRWQCRVVGGEQAVHKGGAGVERIRRRLWGRGRRRRDADDTPLPDAVIGNCGRPADQVCGLKNPDECATHSEIAPGISEAEIQRLIVKGHRNKLRALTPLPANESRSEQLLYLARLKAKHGLEKPSAALVAFDVAHRMRRW